MSRLSESDEKQKETKNEKLEKQRNNRKTKRKSEKASNKCMERQQDLKAPPDQQQDADLQQSKPVAKPGQTRGTQQIDNPHSENQEKQEKFNPTQSKYKCCFEGTCTQTQVFRTIQHTWSCLSMQWMAAQWIAVNYGLRTSRSSSEPWTTHFGNINRSSNLFTTGGHGKGSSRRSRDIQMGWYKRCTTSKPQDILTCSSTS